MRTTDAFTSGAKSHLQHALVELDHLAARRSGSAAGRDFLELEEAHRAIYHALIKIDECIDVEVLQGAS